MRYFVIRVSATGSHEEIAATRYIEDARAILERYYSGFIVTGGAIVESKRFEA